MLYAEKHYTVRAHIIKAIAHPVRLFFVEKLAHQEYCVRELTEMVGFDISTVSKHLRVLKHAGIVVDDKRGNQVFYQLRTPCILNFLGCIEGVINSETSTTTCAC
ncbi:MAG: metalloregulator ArsR/SmtB family transcription factor [Desulfuromonadaceae bacterium]|nr:metalloregulator ArsR/SmtB family transcription factor [Desulfuromonas sp.]MDY0213454.1 metalloregulator ArsR/SmtB family transcription factor [Desulfuromonadaceae bacterium]